MGYVAGMAQLPYMLLSEKKDLSKIKKQSIINLQIFLRTTVQIIVYGILTSKNLLLEKE